MSNTLRSGWFKNIPIAQKLYFTVGVMAALIAIEIFTLWFAMTTLSSLRAYVNGEGLWSKGQKDAVFHLQKYGLTRNEDDYKSFLAYMQVPMGDHKARAELLKPNPDMDVARQGFLEGRNHPDDIDGMIKLFSRFHSISYINKAIVIWGEADDQAVILLPIGEALHKEISSPHPDPTKIEIMLRGLQIVNQKVTVLEDDFSFTLGEGARWFENLIMKLLFAVALTVEISGLILAISLSRGMQKGLKEVIRAAKAIARGEFTARAQTFSGDEIGILAGTINEMADELSKSENKFRKILESAPDAMVIVNRDGIIRLINSQTESLFQYKREEVLGKTVEMLIPGGSHQAHASHRESFFADPKVRSMGIGLELFGKRKDGNEFPVEISLSPFDTEEGIWVSAAIRDITEKKRDHEALREYADKLKASNSNLEQFAYVASHDLQEPLRTITSYVSLLQEKHHNDSDEESSLFMNFVVEAAERMKLLIRELLMYSRIGKDQRTENIDCNEVVEDVLRDMDLLITENKADVIVYKLPVIRAGKVELNQLFLNLIGNAIKYCKPDVAPKIEIAAERQAANWLFSIKDNGIGIDEAYSERIFIIFQRLHNQHEYSGTGIGLATCRKIVELHGGKIWLKSQPGEGSTFYFTFPNHT